MAFAESVKVADPIPSTKWTFKKEVKERAELMKKRAKFRVGMPKVLNMYVYAPLFSAYLETLGLEPENIIYSDYTNRDMYKAGAETRGDRSLLSSKIGIPHVYNLIFVKHAKKPLDAIFFPMIDVLTPHLKLHRLERLPHGDGHA